MIKLIPFTPKQCVDRSNSHSEYARGFADRSRHYRDLGDNRRAVWEQNAAAEQYRIAREYRALLERKPS